MRGYRIAPDGAYETTARGRDLLRLPQLNRGTAFTREERAALGLSGILPAAVVSIEDQVRRTYRQYQAQPTNLAKNIYLANLSERNQVLFYRLFAEHVEEMMPIVYTPTVGEAIQNYSREYRRPNGVYLSIDDLDDIPAAFENFGLGADDVDLLVATDAEGILGIGDWGAGGIGIAVGKIAVYTAAAGIDPSRCIPVMLDAGTDNAELLGDPSYVGLRHPRVRGERYDEFIAAYVDAATRAFPNAMLHWEDMGAANGRRILERYQHDICTFNDDMQGTGAIVLAAVLAALSATDTSIADIDVVIYGAGTAGIGIADQIRDAMVAAGADRDTATRRFWCLGSRGLLLESQDGLRDFQLAYRRRDEDVQDMTRNAAGSVDLAEVVRHVRPTLLIGTSTTPGAFTEDIVRTMAAHVERPLIFPLSNPTHLSEALPADILTWTDGRALISTGSPFDPVELNGTRYHVAQANNALVYPGVGLGTIVARARVITDSMFVAAAQAVAEQVDARPAGAAVLPPVTDLRRVSAIVATRVVEAAIADGVARHVPSDPEAAVAKAMWQPTYRAIRPVDSL